MVEWLSWGGNTWQRPAAGSARIGAIADRSQEHLGVSDRGVAMLRKLLKEQIELVRDGKEPIGIVRDSQKDRLIDLDTFHEPFGVYRSETPTPETADVP